MPVQYEGILVEHRAVRERAGLFDVSHMGEFEFTGPDAFATLQRLTPNDIGKLADGRCHYSAFLTEAGTFVDDLLVYRRKEDSYMLVVNAGNTPKDFEWARSHSGGQLRLENKTDAYALIAVQGPLAVRLVARVADSDPSDLPYYGFRNMNVLGEPALQPLGQPLGGLRPPDLEQHVGQFLGEPLVDAAQRLMADGEVDGRAEGGQGQGQHRPVPEGQPAADAHGGGSSPRR